MNVTILILIFCLLSVRGSQEVPITTEPHNQYDPAVFGNIVVWEDDRNGNYDIYGYNLAAHEEFPITTHPDDQENPAIYENMVVWEDHRNDTWAIYGYNLSTKQEVPTPISGSEPAIYQNIVICITMGGDNPAICGYNLLTEEVVHIGLDPGNVYSYPEIHNNIIVWKSAGKDGQIINAYNMETQEPFNVPERRLFFPIRDQDYPAVYTDTIIWTEDFYNIIYAYNSTTDEKQVIAVTHMGNCEPSSRVRSEVIGSGKPALYRDIIV